MKFIGMKSFVKEDEYDLCDWDSNSIIGVDDIKSVSCPFALAGSSEFFYGIRIIHTSNVSLWQFKNQKVAIGVFEKLESITLGVKPAGLLFKKLKKILKKNLTNNDI